jgi:hypothetical protein
MTSKEQRSLATALLITLIWVVPGAYGVTKIESDSWALLAVGAIAAGMLASVLVVKRALNR